MPLFKYDTIDQSGAQGGVPQPMADAAKATGGGGLFGGPGPDSVPPTVPSQTGNPVYDEYLSNPGAYANKYGQENADAVRQELQNKGLLTAPVDSSHPSTNVTVQAPPGTVGPNAGSPPGTGLDQVSQGLPQAFVQAYMEKARSGKLTAADFATLRSVLQNATNQVMSFYKADGTGGFLQYLYTQNKDEKGNPMPLYDTSGLPVIDPVTLKLANEYITQLTDTIQAIVTENNRDHSLSPEAQRDQNVSNFEQGFKQFGIGDNRVDFSKMSTADQVRYGQEQGQLQSNPGNYGQSIDPTASKQGKLMTLFSDKLGLNLSKDELSMLAELTGTMTLPEILNLMTFFKKNSAQPGSVGRGLNYSTEGSPNQPA